MRIRRFITGILAIGLLAGCATEPQDKLLSAKNALLQADSSGAAIYCETRIAHARWLFDSAATVITAQRGKLPFMRSYKVAENLLVDAAATARAAMDSLPAERSKYRRETEFLIESAREVVAQTRISAQNAIRQGKSAQGIAGEVKDMEEMVVVAAAALEHDDMIKARAIATSTIDKAGRYRSLIDQLPRPSERLIGSARKTK